MEISAIYDSLFRAGEGLSHLLRKNQIPCLHYLPELSISWKRNCRDLQSHRAQYHTNPLLVLRVVFPTGLPNRERNMSITQ